jgi:hypothetical protein
MSFLLGGSYFGYLFNQAAVHLIAQLHCLLKRFELAQDVHHTNGALGGSGVGGF